jgi:cell division protein FtsW (lipid II flippase)
MQRLWKQLAIATNWPVLLAAGVLSAVGILTIWATSPADGQKQLVFLGIALACMLAFQVVDYRQLGKLSWPIYLASLVLILYTVLGSAIGGDRPLPGVSRRNGAYNWIAFGSLTLQPAELMKIGFVMVLARYLRFRSNYRTFLGLLAPFALALVPVLLILKQPDLGTAMVFIPALFAMLYVAGAKVKHLLGTIALGLAMLPIAWFAGTNVPLFKHLPAVIKEYQRERVHAMFNADERTLARTGFQQHNAMIAFGSGGLGGKGAGNIPVGRRVPEARNDMIFALIGEQFGFSGAAVVIVAYLVLFAAGVEIAAANKEPFGRLVAVGVVAMLAGQTFLNLAVATKLFPVTGVTLPFISSGGSSLIASYLAAGLLLNIGQSRPIVLSPDSFDYDKDG